MKIKFKPSDNVTIGNAIQYAEAIDKATKRDVERVPKNERALSLSVIAATLRLVSDQILKRRDILIDQGQADPITEDQQLLIKMIFRRAAENQEGS